MATPWVTVNGQPRRAGWGRSVIPVLPGRYEVRVYLRLAHSINSSTRFSLAQVLVPVSVAQVVELEYKAPLVFSTAGSLGPPPQKYNNLLGMFHCWGIVVAFVVLAIFAPE
jgi:hypothetical protein